MTKIKEATTRTVRKDKVTVENTIYYEVGISEVEEMVRKVEQGGNEGELRKELIKNSQW